MADNKTTVEKVHDLDTRASILETQYENLDEKLDACVDQTRRNGEGVTQIQLHIAKQNGALPRIEASLTTALAKIDLFEGNVNQAKVKAAVISTRQKVIYGIAGILGTTLLAAVMKLIITGEWF